MAKTTVKSKPTANGVLPTSEVLTLPEAAAFLRVSADGLKADAVAGRIPGRLVAGEWRFMKATLIAWLSESEKPAKSSKERMLAAFGAWKEFGEDPEQVIAELRQARKGTAIKGA